MRWAPVTLATISIPTRGAAVGTGANAQIDECFLIDDVSVVITSSDADLTDVAEAAAPDADASDGDAEAGLAGNVLVNGDFEVGCAGWLGSNASLQTETSDVYMGAGAWRVCATGPNGYYIQQSVSMSVANGQHLTATAWVKLPKDKTIMRVLSLVLVARNESSSKAYSMSTRTAWTTSSFASRPTPVLRPVSASSSTTRRWS